MHTLLYLYRNNEKSYVVLNIKRKSKSFHNKFGRHNVQTFEGGAVIIFLVLWRGWMFVCVGLRCIFVFCTMFEHRIYGCSLVRTMTHPHIFVWHNVFLRESLHAVSGYIRDAFILYRVAYSYTHIYTTTVQRSLYSLLILYIFVW